MIRLHEWRGAFSYAFAAALTDGLPRRVTWDAAELLWRVEVRR